MKLKIHKSSKYDYQTVHICLSNIFSNYVNLHIILTGLAGIEVPKYGRDIGLRSEYGGEWFVIAVDG